MLQGDAPSRLAQVIAAMGAGIRRKIGPAILSATTVLVILAVFLRATVEMLRRRSERLRAISPSRSRGRVLAGSVRSSNRVLPGGRLCYRKSVLSQVCTIASLAASPTAEPGAAKGRRAWTCRG